MDSRIDPGGLYCEDFAIGDAYVTGTRTMAGADIVNFAPLAGDFNEVHIDLEYAPRPKFGGPIAHASLVYAVCGGLEPGVWDKLWNESRCVVYR